MGMHAVLTITQQAAHQQRAKFRRDLLIAAALCQSRSGPGQLSFYFMYLPQILRLHKKPPPEEPAVREEPCERQLRFKLQRPAFGADPGEQRITIDMVQKAVCQSWNIPRTALYGSKRVGGAAIPRMVSMYLCAVLTKRSNVEIGRRHGGKDHTTVLHATQRIAGIIGDESVKQPPNVHYERDNELAERIAKLVKQILAQ